MDVTFIDADLITHRFIISAALQNQVHNLTVRLNDGGDESLNAEIRIDRLRFEGYVFEVMAGDVALIDLGDVLGGTSFSLLRPRFSMRARRFRPRTSTRAKPCLPLRAESTLCPTSKPTADSGSSMAHNAHGKKRSGDVTFPGRFGRGQKRAHIRVIDGYSTTGENAVVLAGSVGESGVNNTLDVYQVGHGACGISMHAGITTPKSKRTASPVWRPRGRSGSSRRPRKKMATATRPSRHFLSMDVLI